MSNNNGSRGDLSPILVILVAGSLSLAIADKDNRPAYFDIVKIAMVYSFSTVKSQEKPRKSDKQDNADEEELK